MAHMMAHGSIMPDRQPNPDLVKKIVQQLKINGLFDEMRRDCLADIDTKPAFQNLKQRVEGHVHGILARQQWSPSLNKNQLRSKIRESVMQSGILNEGVDRILYQVFSAKVHSVFLPKIEEFIQEKGDELKKEFLPPPIDVPNFAAPPVPIPPDVQPENFPPMPAQPPPPESPVVQMTNETSKPSENLTSDMSLAEDSVPETTEEIQNYNGEEFYVKDVAPEDVVVKAINTPSPEHLTPEATAEEEAPKIPQEAVNPLRSLIQSLLVSKNTILDSNDNIQEQHTEIVEETIKVKGYSPTIDPSEIEGFTDDEETDNQEQNQGPKTPASLDDGAKHSNQVHSRSASPDHVEPYSPAAPQGEAYTPPSPYSPLSPSQIFTTEETSAVDNKNTDGAISPDEKEYDTPLTPAMAYDPSKFSYQQMSDSTAYTEGTNPQSPPSPTSADVTDVTEKGRQTDENYFFSEDARNDIDMRQNNTMTYKPPKARKRRKSSTDSSGSSSGTISTSSSESENEEIVIEQEVEQEVEEMVEEVEVVEEFTSESGEAQEDDDLVEEEEVKSEKSVEIKPKKKKKKTKKRKTKKARKRTRSSSISSGEITSSGEISSDSSSDESTRPTRPTGPPKQKTTLDLEELEERRREIMREESMRDRPYWANTESSSDYLSSPGRMRHPYSPPRRPYSPEFRRFESERNMEIGFGPHFRDRPMFHDDFRPIHPRFSPPYRRSPPRGYSPGPRIDYPRMPFGSPHSPPRRPYSPPPRMMGGFPGDIRPRFDHPRHRWGSPPRRSSRSPPPGMRRDDGPGPSRF